MLFLPQQQGNRAPLRKISLALLRLEYVQTIIIGDPFTHVQKKIPTTGLFETTGTVLNAIDKTFDFTSDLLGNAVLVSQCRGPCGNNRGRVVIAHWKQPSSGKR